MQPRRNCGQSGTAIAGTTSSGAAPTAPGGASTARRRWRRDANESRREAAALLRAADPATAARDPRPCAGLAIYLAGSASLVVRVGSASVWRGAPSELQKRCRTDPIRRARSARLSPRARARRAARRQPVADLQALGEAQRLQLADVDLERQPILPGQAAEVRGPEPRVVTDQREHPARPGPPAARASSRTRRARRALLVGRGSTWARSATRGSAVRAPNSMR